jgi:Glutamine amidotransferase domain
LCGIVGVASTEGMKNRSERLQFMRMGLDIDSWRGWESTGMALVPQGPTAAPIVYKRAVNGRDFIQLHQTDKYLNDIEKYSVVLGHNRAATTGRGNIVDHNAHPFQYGKITLVHNGHIRNVHEFEGASAGAQCLVDSAQVTWAMNEYGEKEILEQAEGGFVFVWWNSETSTLNIARNTERPLHMAFAAKENTFYWASELEELLYLLKDVTIDEEIGILFPKPMTWYQFGLSNLREYQKVPFVKSQGRHNRNHVPTGRTGKTGEDATPDRVSIPVLEALEETQYWKGDSTDTHRTTTYGPRTTSKADTTEIEEIRQTVANQRLKDIKLSGVPTSRKRISRAKLELKRLGIDYNSLRCCTPVSWDKYKNQMNLGSVLARTRKEGYLIEVLQVRHEDYLKCLHLGKIFVDCVNVRNGPNNDTRIIGVVSRAHTQYMNNLQKIAEAAVSEEGTSIVRDCDGPGGSKISKARFLELTVRGCGNCQCDLDPVQHGTIIWVGNNDTPICPECAVEPAIMESIGFSHLVQQSVH